MPYIEMWQDKDLSAIFTEKGILPDPCIYKAVVNVKKEHEEWYDQKLYSSQKK